MDLIVIFLLGAALFLIMIWVGRLIFLNAGPVLPGTGKSLLKPAEYRLLRNYFPYYYHLSSENKRKFEKRLIEFINDKDFQPRGMPAVTDEMKLLVSACAIQLTFGLDQYLLPHFQSIIIYKEKFRSVQDKRLKTGEVHSAGAIVFSWDDFFKGYIFPADGYNVGLHEMAHALVVEDQVMNEDYHFIDRKWLKKWRQLGHAELLNIRRKDQHFIRKYAGTDGEEMFAVSTEYFFEMPEALKNALPELFEVLTHLYNQNPTRKSSPALSSLSPA